VKVTDSLLKLIPGYDPFATAGECWFNRKAAQEAVDFFPACIKHIEGEKAGQPFELQKWQASVVANLFGWKATDAIERECRRYRECLIYVPRKNGKTPFSAAIALYILFCDPEVGQQNYIAAANREQASFLFRQAKGMIDQEEMFSSRSRIYGGHAEAGQSRSIVREDKNSFLRVVSADGVTKHGGTSHLVLVDELHAQPNRELIDVLTSSTASLNRKQTLVIYATTADYDRPSICNEKYQYACNVRDNGGDPTKPGFDSAFLPVIYEALQEDDWKEEKVWRKANPNLGVSVSLDYLRRESKIAAENPEKEFEFKRLHLNMRTPTSRKWLDQNIWDDCGGTSLEAQVIGLPGYAGLDLGSSRDFTAFVMAFRLDDGKIALIPRFWIPEQAGERRTQHARLPIRTWVDHGWLQLTEGDEVHYGKVRADIVDDCQKFGITSINVDRLFQGAETCQKLIEEGLHIEAFGQGFASMAMPAKDFDERFFARKFIHDGNPVMRWMIGNAVVQRDPAGNMKPDKDKSADKIDGVVSAIMATAGLLAAPPPLVYETRGVPQIGVDESLEACAKAVPVLLGNRREFNWQELD
jgi:phage terminase large subunit-like protein